jgi:hypothetical protein
MGRPTEELALLIEPGLELVDALVLKGRRVRADFIELGLVELLMRGRGAREFRPSPRSRSHGPPNTAFIGHWPIAPSN